MKAVHRTLVIIINSALFVVSTNLSATISVVPACRWYLLVVFFSQKKTSKENIRDTGYDKGSVDTLDTRESRDLQVTKLSQNPHHTRVCIPLAPHVDDLLCSTAQFQIYNSKISVQKTDKISYLT